MTTPRPDDSPQRTSGFRAIDLTPELVAPMLHRFYAYYVEGAPDECWEWCGALNKGYGTLGRGKRPPLKSVLAHRIAWVAATGLPLRDNITIDHLCRNPACVNYHHLEPVSLVENARRARSGITPSADETHLADLLAACSPVEGRGRGGRPRRACSICGIPFTSDYLRKHIARVHLRLGF